MKNVNFRIRITKGFVITVAVVLLLFLFIKENKNQLDTISDNIVTELNEAEQRAEEEPRFKTVYKHVLDNALVIVDTETGVQYLYRKVAYSGGLTVLLDETGKPLLYEEKE